MRILPAGPGAGAIDTAIVVVTNKGTGGGVEDKIAIPIHVNMAGYQLGGPDVQFLSDAVDLGVSDGRTDGAAAVATVEAVEKLKSLFMQAVYCIVKYLLVSLF